ncbi:MAG: hypothetical protein ABI134_05340 [Byssovorax sp.]
MIALGSSGGVHVHRGAGRGARSSRGGHRRRGPRARGRARRREAEQALTKRDAAVAAFEPVYTGVADIAAGLLELAGQGDLASRVKPTVRRRAGLDLPAVDSGAEVPTT